VPVSRRATQAFLDRRLDSWAWIKRVPRERLERELDALRVPPRFKTRPWLHQLACFYLCLHQPRLLLLLTMGLGKSKIVADVVTQLLREGRMRRGLVTVPRLVNVATWQDDLERHSDLGYSLVDCEDVGEKRERLLNPPRDADLTVIDYGGLHLAMCDRVKSRKSGGALVKNPGAVARLQELYDFVDLDECHRLANPGSLWHSIARDATERARFAYGTTGTLFGRRVEDAWPQFYLVDRGETLGENFGLFREAFFDVSRDGWRAELRFVRRMAPELHRMLQHRSIRYDEDEVPEVDLPPRVVVPRRLHMTDEQRGHYDRALDGLISAGGSLAQLDGQWVRMRQICSGYLAWRDDAGDHLLRLARNPKLEELEELLAEMLTHSKVVVSTEFTESGRIVSERLRDLGIGHVWFHGGSRDHAGQRRRFMEDPQCRVFLMNSAAGGEGTDGLQKVARYMVLYESPTSPTGRVQTVKRVHRPGQARRSWVYDLTMRRSLEVGILEAIEDGIDVHDRVVAGRAPGRAFFLSD
jgi:hypothetical protein